MRNRVIGLESQSLSVLRDRVVAAEAVVCPAPYDAEDLDWYAGMDQVNIDEFGWALAGEDTLHPALTREAHDMLARMDSDPTEALGTVELESADRAVLAREDVQQVLHAMVREAFRPGVWGWVDDDLAMTVPWGFDLTEIEVPVTIRYGAEDVLVVVGPQTGIPQSSVLLVVLVVVTDVPLHEAMQLTDGAPSLDTLNAFASFGFGSAEPVPPQYSSPVPRVKLVA